MSPPPSASSTCAPPEAEPSRLSESDPLLSAWRTARADLLAERNAQGHWVGELSSSPLSTATAISALTIAEQHAASLGRIDEKDVAHDVSDRWTNAYQTDLSELICNSARWLAAQQNDDGGWGDTDRSDSNLATTMLVLSALRMTGAPARYADLEPRAEQYLKRHGGVAGLKKRYGRDQTFAAPILTNAALAGVVPWSCVPTLPFEMAALPRSWFNRVGLPVVSYALPALVAIGLAKHHHHPSINPIARWTRRLVTERCLDLVQQMQPDSGGFLEATPLTSFVVMALASAGRSDHPVVRRGVEFLLASVRPDGSWPIDTNLATWNTTLSINALAKGVEADPGAEPSGLSKADETFEWLLACQHTERHPFTGADPGGWAWTNLSGGVPDADDTSGALLALRLRWTEADSAERSRIAHAVGPGVRWLLDLQNRDGGWPTFCRGWGKLPFDRSATDLTAHAIRALGAWRRTRGWWTAEEEQLTEADLDGRIDEAILRGLRFLEAEQAEDGSWSPLWFGNQRRPEQANPVIGTARVLQALHAAGRGESSAVQRALQWLVSEQHADGGWGAAPQRASGAANDSQVDSNPPCSVEETSLAVEALLPWQNVAPVKRAIDSGLNWLVDAVNSDGLSEPAPVGLYFAKLWYHERLYPKSFAVSALGAAVAERVASAGQWGDDRAGAE